MNDLLCHWTWSYTVRNATHILSLWCDHILQWNEHARLNNLNVTTFLEDPLSINFLPFHQILLNFGLGSHIYVR